MLIMGLPFGRCFPMRAKKNEPEAFWWDTCDKMPNDCVERLRVPLSDKLFRVLPYRTPSTGTIVR